MVTQDVSNKSVTIKLKIMKKQLQYFSKLYLKWIDFKSSDCEESLRKYGYKIRVKP